MAYRRTLTPIERDLRDIQFTVNQLVRQLAPAPRRRLNPEAARSLLAAVSYKLDVVQAALRS
ncbi:MAG: hypothetical protein JO171_14020 [Paludibacterium sp.]|uniref:hypothetical protein n=1 Tax=Paludibacterium sp. TaxID=1917523 RepID=UPI0025DFB314|nr:hypothetical protein [Paludibacterium sp.]MBV8048271.1 hypothetical protein [Paludibacterium sp.]MBV8647193.1 hypothetical protein [Paludibacterium sp.]